MNLGEQFKFDYEAAKPIKENVIQGEKYRFTILSERLIRMEYNKDGIFIWALDDDNYDAIFAIRNDRKKYFDFDLENVSVNDWTQEANLIEYKTEVFPGCVAAYGIDFDQDKLAKDGIEQIKKVDFGLDIRPEGDYFSNFHTDPITIDKQ